MSRCGLFHVALCSDDAYGAHTAVALRSLLRNARTPDRVVVWLLDAGLSSLARSRIAELCEVAGASVHVLAVPMLSTTGLPADRHLSAATYGRLFLPELIDRSVDRCLYLDCDLVVLDDVMSLNDIAIDGYCLAATDNSNLKRNATLGMPADARYFNAGVTLLNLPQWRSENITARVLDFAGTWPERLSYHDQDAMNAILYERWTALPLRWNQRRAFFDYPDGWAGATSDALKEAMDHPAIVHFTGPDKPWRYLCDHPYKSAYLRYLDMTPWRGSVAPETEALQKILDRRHIVVFGAGMAGQAAIRLYRHHGFEPLCIVDNDSARAGTRLLGLEIFHPSWLGDRLHDDLLVVVASMYRNEIFAQLRAMGFKNGVDMIERGFEHRLSEIDGAGEVTA